MSNWLESHKSAAEHRANVKAFRVAPPRAAGPGRAVLNIGLLDDADLSLVAAAAKEVAPEIRLGRQHGVLVPADGRLVTMVASQGWTALLDAARPADTFRFACLSPTTFRSGTLVNPMPSPGSIFGHLRARWQAFAPAELQPHIDLRECGLVVSSFDGGTKDYYVRRRRYPGFVGTVTVTATDGSPRDHRVLDALARLTPFCGIGANTTVGMGDATYLIQG